MKSDIMYWQFAKHTDHYLNFYLRTLTFNILQKVSFDDLLTLDHILSERI